jgi:hypothetical protein
VIAAAPVPPAPPPPAAAAAVRPVSVGVGLREWSVTVYRARVRPGRVRFRLTNFGEDAHDLQLVRPGGQRGPRSAEVPPFGGRGTLAATVRRRGAYRLVCALPGHERRGMRAVLRVTRRA